MAGDMFLVGQGERRMMKVVFWMMLTLLLLGTFIFGFSVGLVRAQAETVTINSDGSVSPSSAPISSVDNVTYTFTGDIRYPVYLGVVVARSDCVIDGNGHAVVGDSSFDNNYGVSLEYLGNVTIKNINVQTFHWGIDLIGCTNCTVSGNNATGNLVGIDAGTSLNSVFAGNNLVGNGLVGIEVGDYSNNNVIIGNNAEQNGFLQLSGIPGPPPEGAIFIDAFGDDNTVVQNNIAGNLDGIYLGFALNTNVYHNNFLNNIEQVYSGTGGRGSATLWDNGYPSGGNYWSDYTGTDLYSGPYQNITGSDGIGDTPYIIDANNTDNHPLMNPYSTNSLSVNISPASSTLLLGQSLLFTSEVQGGLLPYTYQWCLNGTAVLGATFSSWTFTPASSGSYTVYLNITDSSGVIATSNTASVLTQTRYDVTFGQTGVGPDYSGTVVTIDGTNYTASDLPVSFSWYDGSTHTFAYQSPLTAEANAEQYVWTGTSGLSSLQSDSITVTTNGSIIGNYKTQYNITFDKTSVGSDFTGPIVVIDGSTYNASALPTSFWYDKGSTHNFAFQSTLVGSTMTYYWNSTTGLSSLQSGSINVTGPGSITGNYVFHEVIVTNITASNTWAYRGWTTTFNVTVSNKGDFSESVWATLYYNITASKSINTYPVNLGAGQNYTLTFTWNTNGVPCLNYTLTAVATIPTGSNTLSDSTLAIRLLGDVNGDGRVDLRDLALVARAFGSTPTSPNWNPACDFYRNGIVNMKDVALVARNFGQHYP
jgi:parallel beta-helix repeat protein